MDTGKRRCMYSGDSTGLSLWMVRFLHTCLKKCMDNNQERIQKNSSANTVGANENAAQKDQPGSNTIKDPDEWTTGDEPMTGAQRSYLKTLSDEAGEELDENMTK